MSKVVVVKYTRRKSEQSPDQAYYKLLLQVTLNLLTGAEDIAKALRLVIPQGIIGMKTNCLTPTLTHTPLGLTDALSELLIENGFGRNNLVVWERTNRELKRAGYKLNASSFGRRCLGTDSNSVGYSNNHYSFGEVNSRVSRILTELVDYNINLPVLKDHSIAGLSAGLKNMYGAIHNPNKYHDNNCDPFAAQVSYLEPIRRKNILTILDATRVQYNGGPGLSPDHISDYGALIVSVDPVAADRIGLEILEHFRQVNNLPSLAKTGRPVNYLKSAEKIGLGIAEISKIDLEVCIVDNNGNLKRGELF